MKFHLGWNIQGPVALRSAGLLLYSNPDTINQ